MKVVAFNGSPRRNGNTAILIDHLFGALKKKGIECEQVYLTGRPIRGCTACMICRTQKTGNCSFDDDIINPCIEKMKEADGIVIASPTYFANLTAETKALIDRAGYVSRGNGNFLKRKVGAAVVTLRRGGAMNVFNGINDFFLINEMIVPGSNYWNMGLGKEIGDVSSDSEGLKTMETLGENMAWLLEKLS